MQIGTQTASLINHLQARSVIGQPEPTVGMGATILCWTDRRAGTIIEVGKIGKATKLVVQEDRATLTSGPITSEAQAYTYAPNPKGSTTTFKQAANGTWQEVYRNPETGRWILAKGHGLRIGAREAYTDPSF